MGKAKRKKENRLLQRKARLAETKARIAARRESKGSKMTKHMNGVASLPDTSKPNALAVIGTKKTDLVPATGAAPATPAAPATAAPATPAAGAQANLPYSHYYGGAYGGRRAGSGYTPPATTYKSAKERVWEEHQEVRAKTVRPVSLNEAGMQTLLNMLTYARPHSSTTEREFISRYIASLPNCEVDDFGNHWVAVGKPNILWSSHTDTVHRKAGIQKIVVGDGIVTAKDNNCLGADCTAGVWIMTEMIKAKVPGLYIFHRQEEIGGRGSSFIAANYSKEIAAMKAAIAFDRRGLGDIITHQGDLCASNEFALSLAGLLNGPGLKLGPCPNGVFTDTANYTEIIGECTNLSVGYFSEHTGNEFLSLSHLFALRDAILKANWNTLVVKRKPGEGSLATNWRRGRPHTTPASGYTYTPPVPQEKTEVDRLRDFVRLYPSDVADVLNAMSVTVDDLFDMIGLLEARSRR